MKLPQYLVGKFFNLRINVCFVSRVYGRMQNIIKITGIFLLSKVLFYISFMLVAFLW